MKVTMFACIILGCDKAYCNKLNLNRHIETSHIGIKKLQCPHCNKCLSSRQNLKEHLFTHTGEKPYICKEDGCNMQFRQGSQLSVHRRIHSAIRQLGSITDITTPKVISTKLTDLLSRSVNSNLLSESLDDYRPKEEISLPPISYPQLYIQLSSEILG